jgi:hypothetical protein
MYDVFVGLQIVVMVIGFGVQVYSSLYPKRLQNSSVNREVAAEMAVRAKLRDRKADVNGMIETSRGPRKFIPLGFEALGGMSSNSKKLVDFIVKEWSLKSGLDKAVAKSAIVSKLSMGIQRGSIVFSICSLHFFDP